MRQLYLTCTLTLAPLAQRSEFDFGLQLARLILAFVTPAYGHG